MDLNPVAIEDLYDTEIAESICVLKREVHKEYIPNELYMTSLYSEEGVDKLIREKRQATIKELIENVLLSLKSGDLYKLNHLLCLLKEVRFSNNISVTEAESLLLILDLYVRVNYTDFNFVNDIMSLMLDLIAMKKIKLKLGWKIYFKLFCMFYVVSKYEFSMDYAEKYSKSILLCDFIKKAGRFFVYEEEDYSFLKAEVLSRLVDTEGQMIIGLVIAQLFLPCEYFKWDHSLQAKFLTILENKTELANYVMLNFCKIINSEESVLIDKDRLIDDVFSLSFCNVTDGLSLTYFNWPESMNKDKNISVTLCYIITNFISHPKFKPYRNKIERNLKILVDLISTELTENSSSESAFFIVKLLLRNIKCLTSKVIEYEVSEYDSFYDYKVEDSNKEIIDSVLRIFLPIVSKCLLYNESATFSVMIEFIALSSSERVYTDFKDIMTYLFVNSENDSNFFFKKITIFLRSLVIGINDKNIFKYLVDVIDVAVDKVSCVSVSLNNSILEFFNILITIILNTKEKSKNLDKLVCKIDTSILTIVKKILQLFSVFANCVEELSYTLLFKHITLFIKTETADAINASLMNIIKDRSLKEKKEFTFLSFFMNFFSSIKGCKIILAQEVWDYTIKSLIDKNELRDISKDEFVFFKNLISVMEDYDYINKEEFIELLGLLLKSKEDKKKMGYTMLRYFLYNITLPVVKDDKIKLPDSETLNFGIKVYESIIRPYEVTIKSVIENREKASKINLEEVMTAYLRTSVSFMLKCNNIFLRDFEDESLAKSIKEYPLYKRIKEIRRDLIENSFVFFKFAKKSNELGKNRKYFRRTFFAQCLEYDRFYHMRLISSYRKYLVFYRELKFSEMGFIYTPMTTAAFYSHVKLFKVKEESLNLRSVLKVLKCYINTEDKLMIDHSLFKTSLMLQNLIPDSDAAINFFNKIISCLDKKLNEIPITIDNGITDLRKFDRIFDVLYSIISVYISKLSDISSLLRTLYKFRLQIDKLKFNTSFALDSLTALTKSVNYFIPKGTSLLHSKMSRVFPTFLNVNPTPIRNEVTQDFMRIEALKRDNKIKMRQYIEATLREEKDKFDSCNYSDSLNLMVDFLTTIKMSISLEDKEDIRIMNNLETYFFNKLFVEDDMLKKRIFLVGLGIICNIRYRQSKSILHENTQPQPDVVSTEIISSTKRNFSMDRKVSKKYNFQTIPLYEELMKSEEGLTKLIDTLHHIQKHKEHMNASKSYGVFDMVNSRLNYVFSPQYNDATLIFERNFLISSLSDMPSLFNANIARILFSFFYFSKFEKAETIMSTIEKLKKCDSSQYDQVIVTNIQMMLISGCIKKLKIKGKYLQISNIMEKVTSLYTFNSHRRIDSELLSLYGSLFRMCTPLEIKKIFKIESSNFTFFQFDDVFAIRVVNLLSLRFGDRVGKLFDEPSLILIESVIKRVMNDLITWVKYSLEFETFYSNYLYIKGYIKKDLDDNYITTYSLNFESEVTNILDFFRKSQTKESLKLLNVLFKEAVTFLMSNETLFVEVVSEFTCYVRLDPQNYKRRMDYNINLLHKASKFTETNYFTFISLLSKKMEVYVFPESFRFCTEMMRKLLLPRINKVVVSHELEGFDKISSILSLFKNGDSRDYFLHYVMSYVITSLDEASTFKIIDGIYSKIKEDKKENRNVLPLVTVLTSFLGDYEVIIKSFTETVILKLKSLNSHLFRNIGRESQIIKKAISSFFNKYSYTFEFVKQQVSHDCQMAILELSKYHSYFI